MNFWNFFPGMTPMNGPCYKEGKNLKSDYEIKLKTNASYQLNLSEVNKLTNGKVTF